MLRILLSIGVGVTGCVLIYVATTEIGTVMEMVMGRMLGWFLAGLVGLAGVVITGAVAFAVAKPKKK